MLKHIVNALRNESKDTETRSAGKQAAGAAMVADGLFGLENPVDGKNTRVGIAGALIMAAIGLAVMLIAYFVGVKGFEADAGDVIVTGEIVDIIESRSDGSAMYSPVVEYTDPATGETYQAGTSWRSSSRPTLGDNANVAFPPGDPAGGKVLSRTGSWIAWAVVAAGAFVVLLGIGKFLVRLATIGFGVKLFLDGRKERKQAGDDRSVVEALVDGAQDVITDVSTARQAEPGHQDAGSTAETNLNTMLERFADGALGGIPGATTVPGSQSATSPIPPPPGSPASAPPTARSVDPEPASTTPAPAPQPDRPRATEPTTPPPGWYANTGGSGYRWWDGAAWTDHVHPPPE